VYQVLKQAIIGEVGVRCGVYIRYAPGKPQSCFIFFHIIIACFRYLQAATDAQYLFFFQQRLAAPLA